MKYSLLAVFLGFTTFLFAQTKPAPSQLTIAHVNVVDIRTGRVLPNQAVVIKDGIIVSVSAGRAHAGAVIDAKGKYLIPGLWDMHVHSAMPPVWDENIIYPLYVANGVTGVRDMGGDPDLLAQRRRRMNRGELLGPHMLMAGPFLAGGKSTKETIAISTPEEARAAVDTLKQRGVDFIKILSNISREVYYAVAEESAKQKISFVGHVPIAVSVAEASEAGQRSIEHLTGFALACSSQESEIRQKFVDARARRDFAAFIPLTQQAIDTYDPAKAASLFTLLIRNHTWQVPTQVWTQTDAAIDDSKLLSDPRLKYVPTAVRAGWDPTPRLKDTSVEEMKVNKASATHDLEILKSAHAAGVPILAGSDGPDPFIFPGFSLQDELEWLVKSGFTPAEAIQAATLKPAEFVGKVDQYGVVEPGHAADMVLLEANPLEDIRNTRKIAGVVLGGKYYSRSELDGMLARLAALASKQ
jgi:cytosine/adenosine deaminase-related metal-dependent hydrolase